jgi:hypothetical protein
MSCENDNLDEIAKAIYSNSPGAPLSIELQLEESFNTGEYSPAEIKNIVFNILYIITLKGIKYLYGADTNVLDLSETQFMMIKMYVNSYGYELKVFANDTTMSPWDIIRNGGELYRYQVHFDKLL